MPPTQKSRSVTKEKFSATFNSLKTQTYYDPGSRGPGSHAIRTIAWNPTGHLIATGSQDRTLRIWNPEKPQVKNSTELRGHTGAIERVAWNPTKEAELASVSTDGTVRFWDVRSKKCIETVQLGARGLSLSWASDGSMVMAGRGADRPEEESLVPISVPSFTVHPALPQYVQTNQTVFAPTTASAKDHTLFITTGNGTVKVATYPRDPPLVPVASSLSSSIDTAATATTGATTSSAADLAHLPPQTNRTTNIAAAASDSHDASTPQPPSSSPSSTQSQPHLTIHHTIPAHPSSCTSIALSPTGRHLATGGSDAIIALCDTTDWVCKRALDYCAGSIRSVGFSFDGAYLAAGSEECGTLEICHVESGDVVGGVLMEGSQAGTTVRRQLSDGDDEVGTVAPGSSGSTGVGNMAQCVSWHPSRYWIAVAGEVGGLKVVGAAGGSF